MVSKKQSSSAFTIVELLVVIVVIGILAAITIVSYTGISSRATVSSLQSDLTNVVTQLKLDQVNSSSFPASLALANGGKGIPSTSGTVYTYAVSNTTTPQTFCITATKNNISYNITQDGNSQPGICPVLNLDAGNIASYPGSGTTWTDLSGNGNSGTLNGGVTYNSTAGGVLSFDGSSGYVGAGNGASLNMMSSITIEAWIYPKSTSTGTIVAKNSPYYLAFGDSQSVQTQHIGAGITASTWAWLNGSTLIPINQWQCMVMKYDGSTEKIYLNGVEDGSIAKTGSMNVSGDTVKIGYGAPGLNQYFNGYISKVRIYDQALSADDILQNFNSLRGRYGI